MNNQDDQINQELKSLCEQLAKPMPARCDDAKIMHIWRECGLPEYFLGNGGTNTKLVEFAARVSESRVRELEQALSTIRDIAAKSRITELEQERDAARRAMEMACSEEMPPESRRLSPGDIIISKAALKTHNETIVSRATSQLQVQLQAVTQEKAVLTATVMRKDEFIEALTSKLAAVTQERDAALGTKKIAVEEFAKEESIAQLQAHNKAMRKALEVLLGNERCPAWADKIIRAALRTEVPKP